MQRARLFPLSGSLKRKVAEKLLAPLVDGARPLQRRVEELVVAPLSACLVAHPQARDCGLSFASRDGVLLEAGKWMRYPGEALSVGVQALAQKRKWNLNIRTRRKRKQTPMPKKT